MRCQPQWGAGVGTSPTAGSEVNDAELGGKDHQQGQRKTHRAQSSTEAEARLLLGSFMWDRDLILTQRQYKHKKTPLDTHTEVAAATYRTSSHSVPLSSVISRLAKLG